MPLLEAILSSAASTAASEAIRRAFFSGEKGRTMSYEIVGYDDDEGSIGGLGNTEIIGLDEVVGGDDDLLDALSVSGAPKGRATLARKIKNKRAVVVTDQPLRNRRRFPIGFVPTTVVAATTANITSNPQNVFRPERFVVPSDIAFDFGLVDLKVGNESQFVSGGEVPCAAFTEVSIDTDVSFKTAEVGNQLIASVRNKDAVNDIEFTAAMIGTTLR